MRPHSFCRAYVTACLGMSVTAALLPRQKSGAVDSEVFLRRGFHQTAILDKWLFIDGGDFAYLESSKGFVHDYSNTLLAVDLTKDFQGGNATITSIQKPPGAPSLLHGALWVDEKEKLLYVGFAGVQTEFNGDKARQPYGLWSFKPFERSLPAPISGESGSWANLNDTTPAFKQVRPFFGQGASGDGKGYYLSGANGDSRGQLSNTPGSGMMIFDFSTKLVTNQSVAEVPSNGNRQTGGLHLVPNFGGKGILVALGGVQFGFPMKPISLLEVEIFDIASGRWFAQKTNGDAPPDRREFCVAGAASAQGTYEIFVYAGHQDVYGSDAVINDKAWVLSLPSFHWFKADYPPLHPRQGHTCEHAGGGQVITIGGVDSKQNVPERRYQATFETKDNFPNGLGIFDMEKMEFVSTYRSQKRVYNSNLIVQDWNTKHPELPITNPLLAEVFKTRNFTSVPTSELPGDTNGTTPAPTPTDGAKPGGNTDSAKSNIPAIAGGVAGGVAGLGLIAVACGLYIRSWKKKQAQRKDLIQAYLAQANGEDWKPPPQYAPVETNGDHARELPAPVQYEMWAGDATPAPPPTTRQAAT